MSIHKASRDAIVTAVPSVPITAERPPFEDWEKVKNAGVARANIAVTEESPDGATLIGYTRDNANRTVLQQHTTFFDLNSNGVITPWETYIGFRLLSWNILLALLATLIIHSGFSYPSQPKGRWLPDPLFRIYIHRLHLCKHGSDSGTYDHEGRFRAQQLADFFSKYGERVPVQGEDDSVVGETGGLTYVAALRGVVGQRCVMDFFGMFAAVFEWTATYITIWPHDGIMRLEDVRGVFDGSYFYKVAGDRRAKYLRC